MIKFFRNIRQNMIKQNKVSNYLLYAIGEIVLVVIGILIALQVNNWNIEKNKSKLEKVLLAQVKDEILEVYKDLESDLTFLNQGNRSYLNVLNYIQKNVTYADSMCFDFYWLAEDEYIYPEEAVYSKIKEEGLDIIKNDSIKYLLQDLYEGFYPRISRDHPFKPDISESFSDYYQKYFKPNYDISLKFKLKYKADKYNSGTLQFPYEYDNDGMKRLETVGYIPLDFEALKKDTNFQILMRQTREYRNYKRDYYSNTKKIIEQILTLIDKELAND